MISPLQNFRVLDFTWVLVGPITAMLFADMGAEVIKVENKKRLDSLRMSSRNKTRNPEDDPAFHIINRNKLGITVDMTNPRGGELLRELARVCDIVVENFSPGVLGKHGLDYESLRSVNPQIIMVSLSGAGQNGPLKDIVTYGPTATALSGMTSVVGYYGERPLGPWGYADPNSAVYAAAGVLAALRHRQETGVGQYIDACQWEGCVVNLGEALMDYSMNARVQGTQGNRHPQMAPHNIYPCSGEDKWVSIAVQSEEEWLSFCRASGHMEWAEDKRFSDTYRRVENQEALDKLISSWTNTMTRERTTELLQGAGVAAMPTLAMGEQADDPHFREIGGFVEVAHPHSGKELLGNVLWQLGGTPGAIRRPAPMLGQHNDYVFRELLGKRDDEIERLAQDQVIG